MKICVLSSSSSGNSVYFEVNNNGYLLDAGISARKLEKKLLEIGVEPSSIKGIFITHEHSDHVAGLAPFFKRYSPTIYITKGTYKGLKDTEKSIISPIYCKFVKKNEEIIVGDMHVLPFALSHDVYEPVGYKISYDNKSFVYLTDTGVFEAKEELKNSDLYILEANHEEELLKLSNRPWSLIERIMSEYGHLSNNASAELFSELMGENTKKVVLFHLSNECNTKELAVLSYENYFKKHNLDLSKFEIIVSSKDTPTEIIEV